MKKTNTIFLLMGLLLIGFSTCKKDNEPPTGRFKINKEKEKVTATTTSVAITGEYDFAGKVKSMFLQLGTDNHLFGSDEYEVELSNKAYSVTVSDLLPGTEYYYRYVVDYGDDVDYESEIYNFTTKSESPTVTILEALALDSTTYRIKCEVVSDGGQEVTERGICYNTYGDPTMDDEIMQHASGGSGQYTIRMENLELGKKYYVRAYAKNAAGIGMSETLLDFVTEAPQGMPVEIELSCDPEEGGSVSGGGTYEIGTQCTVTAVANAGYTFVNWTENGSQVSSDAQYTFTVSTGRSLVATFTRQAYVITAQVDPEDSGTVTGAGGYNYGEECTLTATANTGYDFVKWTKGNTTVSTDPAYTFTVTTTATYVAHFQIKSYTVSVSANPTNGGTVTGGGTINYGQSCTVHAVPTEGYAFTNWTDNGDEVSTDADYTFAVTGNRTLVAHFTELQPDEYSVTVSANPNEGGTVTGGGTYQQGQQCTVNATAKPGFNFVNWTENGNQVSDLAEYTFTVESNRTLVANFEVQAPIEYTVSVSANPSNGGTVTGGGTYEQGQQCTVAATAATGYTFTNWTENGSVVSTNASYTFVVNNDRTLVANFSQQSYTISASADPSNGGTVSGAGTYNHGQSCTLSATAAEGYTFTNWTENGNQVSTNANYTFTVTGNRTLVANFAVQAPNTFTINVSANPGAGGTVTGGGSYNQGSSCTVTASANTGYTFLRWTENGTQVSTNANYTFTVTGNRTLVANFTYNGGGSAPQGAINGRFTINANGNQVYFSQGNLQYQASTHTWRFATNQYDYIGDDNSNISQTYSGWIDLFGWGTSGWDCGNTYYRPWDSDNSDGNWYGPRGNNYNLTGIYANSDWGVYNAISNGGNQTNQWRTLTGGSDGEWEYVFDTRSTTSGIRYAKAQVAGVNGVILLPDDWSTSTYSLTNTNTSGASFSSNVVSASQWTTLENAGAVFLPAAGYRYGTTVSSVGSYGHYWSASCGGYSGAWCVNFGNGNLYPSSHDYRYDGQCVRLVCPAE